MFPPDGRPTKTILVADDDATARMLMAESLRADGFAVREAGDGAEALELFREETPDLVILDVLMPRMDGFQACAALRALPGGASVPVLVITGMDDVDAITGAFAAGATDFATKPVSWPMLIHRLRYMLRSKETLDELRRSEGRLERAQRIAGLGYWEWDLQSGAQRWSEETFRLLGVPPDKADLRIDDYLESIHPHEAAAVSAALAAAARGEAPYQLDHRVVLPDGTSRHLEAQAELVEGDKGQRVLSGTLLDITHRKQAESRIRELAYFDALTGLPNRILFQDRLQAALASARRRNVVVATMFIDLDNFKRINDTLGHTAGDRVLTEVADRLKAIVRSTDIVIREGPHQGDATIARLGGDEFIVLLTDVKSSADVVKVSCRVLEILQAPIMVDGHEVFVSASVGISLFPQDGANAEELLKNADAALFHAKDSGRNNFQFYSPALNQAAFHRLSMEGSLRRAIVNREFTLFYQPQVDVSAGQIIGGEALIRWNHPDLGLVMPVNFITLAEEAGLITAIGDWVLEAAVDQVRRWHIEGYPGIRVAINLSAHQFRNTDLPERLTEVARAARVSPQYLEIEITESTLMSGAAQTIDILRDITGRGFRISIDDFGTGYSSLTYLKRFPIDMLKIDRSFVRDLTEDSDDAAIVCAISAMAARLGIETLAEGVETASQRLFLQENGCRLMQGYLFGKPVPPADFERLLASGIPALVLGTV